MSNHSIVKAGLCVGLMAASLGAVAASRHTFAEPMIYYKVTGSAVNYVAFVPSMMGTGVLLLDLYQSGTSSSWNYAAGVVNAAAGGAVWSYYASHSTSGMVSTTDESLQFVSYDALGVGTTINWTDSTYGTSSVISSSWYGGDISTESLAFTQAYTVSSQACNITFGASLNTDDYMIFAGFTVRPDTAYPTASDSVSYRTKSGTVAGDTASMGSAAWNALNFSTTSNFPTFSAFSVPDAVNGAGGTQAASVLSKANLCTTAYTNKNALNSAGSFIGAKAGLMRLW